VVALGSSKSCCGHTEGTAGLTGTLLAAVALEQQLLTPIVNLRELNPYVSAALADWQTRHAAAAAPSRQLGGAAHLASSGMQRLAGTSSFGMSGVNAHALLSAPAAYTSPQASAAEARVLSWQRSSYWASPTPHPLLLAATAGPSSYGRPPGRLVECIADLSTSSLAWFRDHAVNGRALLPAAAMFELAAAAATACTNADGSIGGSSVAALTGLSILAPCMLPEGGSSLSFFLRAIVDSRSGAVEVLGSSGSRHLSGAAAVIHLHQPVAAALGGSSERHKAAASPALLHQAVSASKGHNFASIGASRQDTAG
jgi:acyl transferase domain-containing protein